MPWTSMRGLVCRQGLTLRLRSLPPSPPPSPLLLTLPPTTLLAPRLGRLVVAVEVAVEVAVTHAVPGDPPPAQ